MIKGSESQDSISNFIKTDNLVSLNELKDAYGIDHNKICPSIFQMVELRDEIMSKIDDVAKPNYSKEIKELDIKIKKQQKYCARMCNGIGLKAQNINCINGLGELVWLDYEKCFNIYATSQSDFFDPSQQSRKKFTPVGLKNLGATCYMNALLQTWFFLRDFRGGVYKICADDPTSAFYQLQLVFAHLEKSELSVYNPKNLVDSIGLKESEQQDANEFYRLFTNLLERRVDMENTLKQNDSDNFIRKLFGGVYAHSTVCTFCGHKSTKREAFNQIEINFKDKGSLEESIHLFLREELLKGDNQYFCSFCRKKRNAKRFTELIELPPVINFQIMRFVYDVENEVFQKKKVSSMLKFPLEIDMSKFISDSSSFLLRSKTNIYDLHAVLVHAGDSAYSGHYIANVLDGESNCWYRLNDEICEALDTSDTRFMFDVDHKVERRTTVTGNSAKRRKISAAKKDNSNAQTVKDMIYSSRNAYMLIYKLREKEVNMLCDDHVYPPDEIAKIIDMENRIHNSRVDSFLSHKKNLEKKFNVIRNEKITAINQMHRYGEKDFQLIPKELLSQWLSVEHPVNKPPNITENLTGTTSTEFLCEHGGLSLDKIKNFKLISRRSFDQILTSENAKSLPLQSMGIDSLCEMCVLEKIEREKDILHHKIQVEAVCRILKESAIPGMGKILPNQRTKTRVDGEAIDREYSSLKNNMNEGEKGQMFWISKEWLSRWLKSSSGHMYINESSHSQSSPLEPPFREDVICQHNKLEPTNLGRILIPWSIWKFFCKTVAGMKESADCIGIGEFMDSSMVCTQCLSDNTVLEQEFRLLKEKALKEKSMFKRILSQNSYSDLLLIDSRKPNFMISKTFFTKLKNFIQRPDRAHPPKSVCNRELLCEHDKVFYDIGYFDNNLTLSNSSKVFNWESSPLNCHLSKDLILRPPLAKPYSDKIFSHDLQAPFHIVNEDEMKMIEQSYDVDVKIPIWKEHIVVQDKQNSEPVGLDVILCGREAEKQGSWDIENFLICFICWKKWILSRAESNIYIRRFEMNPNNLQKCLSNRYEPRCIVQLDHSSSNEITQNSIPSSPITCKNPRIKSQSSTRYTSEKVIVPRKNRRIRQSGLINLSIKKTDCIRDIKVMIMHFLGVTPIQQRLFYFGNELEEHEATVQSLEILPESIVDVLIIENEEDNFTIENEIELGFSGTALTQPLDRETIDLTESESSSEKKKKP